MSKRDSGAWGRSAVASGVRRLLRILGSGAKPPIGDEPLGRIAVVATGGWGDIVVMTGLVRTLRCLYPESEIEVVTDVLSAEVFSNNPDVTRVVATDDIRFADSYARYFVFARMLRQLSRRPYDAVFLLHPDFASRLLMLFARSRYVVGYGSGDDFALTHSSPLFRHEKGKQFFRGHWKNTMHDLVRALRGEPVAGHGPVLVLSSEEERAAHEFISEHGLSRPIVTLAIGTIAIKRWPLDRFAELAHRCVRQTGGSVLVIGSSQDAGGAGKFDGPGERICFAAGRLDLRQSIALIETSDVLVGADTGAMHAAAAFGVPSVTLFGPTLVENFGYSGPKHIALAGTLDCVPCGVARCRLLGDGAAGVSPCMEAIEVAEVMSALQMLLDE